MKILHTSDWHLGRTLYGRKRYEEFEQFFDWLTETISKEKVDVLLVAGDVFDTTAPSNRAQELYYRFLCRVAASCCRHVVIVAGNHDSPSFLNAPKELLKALDVHVVGAVSEKLEDNVLLLKGDNDLPELIICAVPYLRDKDLRIAEAGESIEEKERKLLDGIKDHYTKIAALAQHTRLEVGVEIPIIATGHLFTAGGQTIDGDGVRDLYIGSLAHVTANIFPVDFNYVALGHLHIAQQVKTSDVIRYSGAPIPMGFGESQQQKCICLVEFDGVTPSIRTINVPAFQKLERIKGSWEIISGRLLELSTLGSQAWLEIVYEDDEIIGDMRQRIDTIIAGKAIEILRVKNNRIIERVLGRMHEDETLDDLNPDDVFNRCLQMRNIPDEQRSDLVYTYKEIVRSIQEADINKE